MDTVFFFSAEKLARTTKRYRAAAFLCAAVLAAANGFCLWLLIAVRPQTEKRYTLLACAAAAAGAVLAAALWQNLALPLKRRVRHGKTLLAGERERFAFTGGLQTAEAPERIPGSVAVCRVTANGRRFFVSKEGAKALRALAPQSGTLEAVNGYITALLPEKEPDV